MPYTVKNLPSKSSKENISVVIDSAGDFRIQTEKGTEIVTICGTSKESIARGILHLTLNARDAGYRQAKQELRNFINED